MKLTPMPCPFCGAEPQVYPTDPTEEGGAWGEVRCVNSACPAQPSMQDGISIADERGSDVYKEAAIQRWNQRAALKEQVGK